MWTDIDIKRPETKLGELPRDGNTSVFTVPETLVPAAADAKEILVYAWVLIGDEVHPGSDWHFKISVEFDSAQHEASFYLYAHTDPNVVPKWNSLNSDNVWLPMPADRKLRATRLFIKPGPTPGNITGPYFYSEVRIVAYR